MKFLYIFFFVFIAIFGNIHLQAVSLNLQNKYVLHSMINYCQTTKIYYHCGVVTPKDPDSLKVKPKPEKKPTDSVREDFFKQLRKNPKTLPSIFVGSHGQIYIVHATDSLESE